jgi:hypothetical protein
LRQAWWARAQAEEAFPGPRHAGDENSLVFRHPAAGGELADDGFVELTPRRVVDRLEARLREFQFGVLQGAREAFVLPRAPLGVDEQGKAFVKGERGHVGLLLLLRPGRRHGGEFEGLKLFECRGVEHPLLLREMGGR